MSLFGYKISSTKNSLPVIRACLATLKPGTYLHYLKIESFP